MALQLISSDGKTFETTADACKWSETIKHLYEDCAGSDETLSIPLPNVHSSLIPKILEFFDHYLENPPAEDKHTMGGGNVINTDLTEFDKAWVPDDKEVLAEYILAASYLECFEMLNVCIQTTANMIKGKTVEQLRELFNVPAAEIPTESELEEIKKNNAFLLPDEAGDESDESE